MFKRNLSQNNDISLRQTLTKFNLTNYKTKNKEEFSKNHVLLKFNEFILKKQSPKHRKDKNFKSLNKNWYEAPTFQTLDVEKMLKRRKKKSQQSINIQVTSRSQKHLIEFMNPQNLPKISIKNARKQSSLEKLVQAANDQKKFRKFTQSYFRSVEKAKQSLGETQVQQQFAEVKVIGWSVKGYVIKGNLILKAIRWVKKSSIFERQKQQKYKKFVYSKQIQQKVNLDYEQFVKDWLYFDQVLSK